MFSRKEDVVLETESKYNQASAKAPDMKSFDSFSETNLKDYWDRAARTIRSYHDAPSTRIYLEQEKKLIADFFTPLKEKAFLKTDLWNEAKNTKILFWVRAQGAKTFGMDISPAVVQGALGQNPNGTAGHFHSVADLRRLPFADDSFEAIYSMGTMEHFPEYEAALREIHRVLKPQGKAIIGVPNKFDPFLRPAQVALLQSLGLYLFGYEKSFSKSNLTSLLNKAGFKIVAQSSLLFMPGILRIMDLCFYTHAKPLLTLSWLLLKPFAFLYNRSPLFRRHGYLLAFVVEKSGSKWS